MRLSRWLMLVLLVAALLAGCAVEGGISILPPESGGDSGAVAVNATTLLILIAVTAVVAIAAAGLRR